MVYLIFTENISQKGIVEKLTIFINTLAPKEEDYKALKTTI